MKANRIKEAVDLADKVGYVFIATADTDGIPHIAAAGLMKLAEEDGCVLLREWFCPGTVKNLKVNPAMSIVIWDKDSDTGCQLLGHLKSVRDIGILDGYRAGLEEQNPLPQVEKQLLVYVESILDFKRGPHSDSDVKERDFSLFRMS